MQGGSVWVAKVLISVVGRGPCSLGGISVTLPAMGLILCIRLQGTSEAPRCGFSGKVVDALRAVKVR